MNHNTKSHQDDNFKDVFSRIGSLARLLRDSMINLGLDRAIMEAAEAIPDARDRLNYVVGKTSQAADRVLTCVETARPLQDRLTQYAQPLDRRWDDWFAAPVDASVAQQLVIDTRQFIKEVPQIACQTNEQLMEIMMAQDFQDLTGQVIKRMMALIGDIEKELIQVLVENMPEQPPAAESVKDSLKNGPPINMHEAGVVASQDQVDDLLESLGF